MEGVAYNYYMIPRKIVEDLENAFGKDKAPVLVEALEQGLNSIQRKNEEQRIVLKAELKDEITKELVTKDYLHAEIKKLENSLIKWVLGLFIAQIAVFVGIIQLLGK